MSRFRRLEIFDPHCEPYLPPFDFEAAISLFNPCPRRCDLLNDVADLFPFESELFYTSYRRHPSLIEGLCDRVDALEEKFNVMMLGLREKEQERKYTWTAEIKGPEDRKLKWVSEIECKHKKHEVNPSRSYKWTAEVKGGKDSSKKYSFEVSNKKKSSGGNTTRVVEIGEPSADRGALALKQAFSKRVRLARGKGKELSPQDAAMLIQINFKAYLVRRSRALRALRELAIAKSKLKEIRALFNNFTYRRQVVRDAEERQRFSERIIVLLLTVDAIEGADLMVRGAKRTMIDEMEAMLDVVDPQPGEKLASLRRRRFDVPDGLINQEIAGGVAQVVQLIEDAN